MSPALRATGKGFLRVISLLPEAIDSIYNPFTGVPSSNLVTRIVEFGPIPANGVKDFTFTTVAHLAASSAIVVSAPQILGSVHSISQSLLVSTSAADANPSLNL